MTIPREIEKLLNDLIEGQLTPDEERDLNTRLEQDPELRGRYRKWMDLHAQLHWNHGAAASLLAGAGDAPEKDQSVPGEAGVRRLWRAAVLATVIGLFGVAGWWWRTQTEVIATLESVTGPVTLDTGRRSLNLSVVHAQVLTVGRLLLDGEGAAVQFRYSDGTLISLTGPAELGLTKHSAKRLDLRQGVLTAKVRPQAAQSPLVIETPTARLAVMGTVFSVEAEAEWTRLQVESGRVRLERHADGRVQDVVEQQACVATRNAQDAFEVRPLTPSTQSWRRTFAKAPLEQWKGDWQAQSGDAHGVMRGVQCVMGRERSETVEGGPLIHYGVSVRPSLQSDLGRIDQQGSFLLTYFVREPASIQVMLGVQKPDGSFGSNFELLLPPLSGELTEFGFRTISIPLSEFSSKSTRYPALKSGDRPYWLLVTTLTKDVGLEISEIGLVSSMTELTK